MIAIKQKQHQIQMKAMFQYHKRTWTINSGSAMSLTAFSMFLCFLWTGTVIAAAETPNGTSAQQYLRFALKACDQSENQLPEMTRVAEIVAEHYIKGGLIG